MKLNIVPARTGLLWVKLGIQTFWRQPLAFTGLFFMYLAAMSVVTLVPYLGSAIALALLPAVTLGLMAATQEAASGKFPMPTLLLRAFQAGKQQARAMVTLGALYALCFLAVMGLSALIDGGQLAKLYLVGGQLSTELVTANDFQVAMWVATLLYLPLSLLFWHAPALVHWHQISPVKSLFFSAVACLRNIRAFTIYGLAWTGISIAVGLTVVLIGTAFGNAEVMAMLMLPAGLLLAAMFFTSIYFTFKDCFIDEELNS